MRDVSRHKSMDVLQALRTRRRISRLSKSQPKRPVPGSCRGRVACNTLGSGQLECGSCLRLIAAPKDGIGRSPLAPQMHPRKRDAEIGRRRQAREMLVTSSKKVSAKFWTEFSADPARPSAAARRREQIVGQQYVRDHAGRWPARLPWSRSPDLRHSPCPSGQR